MVSHYRLALLIALLPSALAASRVHGPGAADLWIRLLLPDVTLCEMSIALSELAVAERHWRN